MNKQITYWKANRSTTAALKEIDADLRSWLRRYQNFAHKKGMSTTVVTGYNICGDETVVGFVTKRGQGEPDHKLWKKDKRLWKGREFWQPKAVKGMEWWKQHQYDCFHGPFRIENALEIKVNFPGGLGYCLPGVTYVGESAYLQLQAWQGQPAGCRRVTDITYEKAVAK